MELELRKIGIRRGSVLSTPNFPKEFVGGVRIMPPRKKFARRVKSCCAVVGFEDAVAFIGEDEQVVRNAGPGRGGR